MTDSIRHNPGLFQDRQIKNSPPNLKKSMKIFKTLSVSWQITKKLVTIFDQFHSNETFYESDIYNFYRKY